MEEDKLIPGYLKLGLSKIYPQYASYSIRHIEDEYFAFTVRKLMEKLSEEYAVIFEVCGLNKLDGKSKMVIDYLYECNTNNRMKDNFKLVIHTD